MSSRQVYTIYVVIFRTRPDHQWTRHTGIWFNPIRGNDRTHFYFHARRKEGMYEYEERLNWNPLQSDTFAGQRLVGSTRQALTGQELQQLMRNVPMTDIDNTFNCQAWVVNALAELEAYGILTREENIAGADSMVELTLEASDDRM